MAADDDRRAPVLFVLGTRPEAIKIAPIVHQLARAGGRPLIVATGQHRDLAREALAGFGLLADHDLGVMREGQRPEAVLGLLVPALTEIMQRVAPAWVVVQGDTVSTLAGALAAAYARVPLAHVEAGLRTGVAEPFPEEMHRRQVAQLADVHFAPTALAVAALQREGVGSDAIHLTGNSGIDALLWMQRRLAASPGLATLPQRLAHADHGRPWVLVTVHRRENHGARLAAVLAALATLAEEAEILLPVHPHPAIAGPVRAALAERRHVHLLPPLAYPDFVWLMGRATLALTDSGGVQEEAPALGLPVLVLRETTERVEGMASGNARLVGTATRDIVGAARGLLRDGAVRARMAEVRRPYGGGDAARRISRLLLARGASARPAVPAWS